MFSKCDKPIPVKITIHTHGGSYFNLLLHKILLQYNIIKYKI